MRNTKKHYYRSSSKRRKLVLGRGKKRKRTLKGTRKAVDVDEEEEQRFNQIITSLRGLIEEVNDNIKQDTTFDHNGWFLHSLNESFTGRISELLSLPELQAAFQDNQVSKNCGYLILPAKSQIITTTPVPVPSYNSFSTGKMFSGFLGPPPPYDPPAAPPTSTIGDFNALWFSPTLVDFGLLKDGDKVLEFFIEYVSKEEPRVISHENFEAQNYLYKYYDFGYKLHNYKEGALKFSYKKNLARIVKEEIPIEGTEFDYESDYYDDEYGL